MLLKNRLTFKDVIFTGFIFKIIYQISVLEMYLIFCFI